MPIDPLAVQRTEIFRGPAALRFGSQAVGGIVEATNNRIPTVAPPGGVAAELRAAGTTVDNGWETGLLLDAGGRNAAIHADVYGRRADDYRIPSYPYLFPPDPAPAVNGRQPNSSLRTEGAAVGGSYLLDGGYAGVAISRFASDYHVPGLEAAASQTHIRLEQTKITSKGEYRPQSAAIAAVRYWAGYTDYKHDEIGLNGIGVDQINATFKNRQSEGKAELETMPMITPFGALTSIVGSQVGQSQLDTSGEALLFPARTRTAAGYFFNEMQHAPTLRTQLAGRVERVNVTGTAVTFPPGFLPPPDDPSSAPADLTFLPKSISFSAIKELPSYLAASVTLQRIERAPRAVELFSKGPHDATQTFDIGNASLKIETAKTAEVGLKRTNGEFRFDAKAYYTRYDDFIFQQPTGNFCGEDFASCGTGTELLQTFIAQRDAIFRGAEVAWQWDVRPLANGIFGLDGQFDTVRATFTDGSNVPRMPPTRVGGGAYLAKRQLVRPHGLAARLLPDRRRSIRDPDERIQSRSSWKSCTENSGSIRLGGRSRSRPASSATTCWTRISATQCSFIKTKSCSLGATSSSSSTSSSTPSRPAPPATTRRRDPDRACPSQAVDSE